MIDGIKIDVKSDELRAHIQMRAIHHDNKAKWYNDQIRGLKSGGIAESGNSNDPVGSLQNSMRNHQEKFALFQFMADHIVPDEVYRLAESDLSRLEFVSRYF